MRVDRIFPPRKERNKGEGPRSPRSNTPMKASLVKIGVPTSQENSPGAFPSLGGCRHASIALLSVDAALLRRRSSLRSTCAAKRQEDRQIRKTALSAHYQASRPPRSGAYRPSIRAPGGEFPVSHRPTRGFDNPRAGKCPKRRRKVSSVVWHCPLGCCTRPSPVPPAMDATRAGSLPRNSPPGARMEGR